MVQTCPLKTCLVFRIDVKWKYDNVMLQPSKESSPPRHLIILVRVLPKNEWPSLLVRSRIKRSTGYTSRKLVCCIMSSSSDDEEPSAATFKPRLSRVAEWFTDRNLSYSRRLERALLSPDYGITSLEEMKVITISEWKTLLRDDAFLGEEYSMVKWRVFEQEFHKLTAEEFDATKSKPIPIKDTSEGSSGKGETSKRKKKGTGGSKSPNPIKGFFSVSTKSSKYQKPNARSAASQHRAADEAAEQPAASSSPVANKDDQPLIEPYNWRSGRTGVEELEDITDALERASWKKSPPLDVLPQDDRKEKGITTNDLEDISGLYEKLRASRATSDAEMADLVKAEKSRRRRELAARHPDKGGCTHDYQEWDSKWTKDYEKAVLVLGDTAER